MLSNVRNVFKVPDLRNKVLFTLAIIVVYRVGAHVPVPGVDTDAVKTLKDQAQQSGRGAVMRDSFTHGSAEQRVQWLSTGLKAGQVKACNTFDN